MERACFRNAMASLAVKVLFVALAIAARQVLVSAGGSPDPTTTTTTTSPRSSDSSDSSEGSGDNECSGIIREGEPCQNDLGVCTRVAGPGKRYGQMVCVIETDCAPGYPGDYTYQPEWKVCWSSPPGTTITLNIPAIIIENCPWDKILTNDDDDATVEETLCDGTYYNYQYDSSSNHVCLSLIQDDDYGQFKAFCVYVSWNYM